MDKNENKIEINDSLKKIIPHILLHSSFIPNIGLLHGKMGIVLFFAHYSRYSGDSNYDDFASILLDEIYDEIHNESPVNFENGLCGIGWGVEYLVQNGFMEGETDEILEDIDRCVMERDPRRITDMSFRKGLGGIAFYVMARLAAKRREDQSAFNQTYLKDLQQALNISDVYNDDENPKDLIEHFQSCLLRNGVMSLQLELPMILFNKLPELSNDIHQIPLGIVEGLSGIGLKKMGI